MDWFNWIKYGLMELKWNGLKWKGLTVAMNNGEFHFLLWIFVLFAVKSCWSLIYVLEINFEVHYARKYHKMEHAIQCHGAGGLKMFLHSCLLFNSNNYNSYSSLVGSSKTLVANGCNIQYCWLVRMNIKYGAAVIHFRILPYDSVNGGEGNGNGSIQHAQIS